MKRCLLILICIVIPICVRSQVDTLLSSGRIPMYAKVISDEKSFGSSFVINTRFYMLDTITIDSVKYELPSCFSLVFFYIEHRRQDYKDILSAKHKALYQS